MKNKNLTNYVDSEKILNDEYELICEITKIRIESKVSQKELEGRTGISQPNIVRFEKNIHNATLFTTLKILDALGYKLKIVKK
jgi:predicted transcriptional regulator